MYFNALNFVPNKMDADTQEGVANNSERVSLETNKKNRRKTQNRIGLCGSAMLRAKGYVAKV